MWTGYGSYGRQRWEEELARYTKWEYGDSEIGWIVSQVNGERKGLNRFRLKQKGLKSTKDRNIHRLGDSRQIRGACQ